MPSFSAVAVSDTDQSSNKVAIGVGVAAKLVVGRGGDLPPPPPPPAYVGVANGVGLELGVGKFVWMGLAVVTGDKGTPVGEGKVLGLGPVVTVATGIGDSDGETWAGSEEQPTATRTVTTTRNKVVKAPPNIPLPFTLCLDTPRKAITT